jgi:hypothetical protein
MPLRPIVLPGTIGNVLEWYDFGVYGYFATIAAQGPLPSSGCASARIGALAL